MQDFNMEDLYPGTADPKLLDDIREQFKDASEAKVPVFVVTEDLLDLHPELVAIAKGLGGEVITCNHLPEPKTDAVVMVGERGSGKAAMIKRFQNAIGEAIRETVTRNQPVMHRGCHIHAEKGGRTSKGDRRRKRQQWSRK